MFPSRLHSCCGKWFCLVQRLCPLDGFCHGMSATATSRQKWRYVRGTQKAQERVNFIYELKCLNAPDLDSSNGRGIDETRYAELDQPFASESQRFRIEWHHQRREGCLALLRRLLIRLWTRNLIPWTVTTEKDHQHRVFSAVPSDVDFIVLGIAPSILTIFRYDVKFKMHVVKTWLGHLVT